MNRAATFRTCTAPEPAVRALRSEAELVTVDSNTISSSPTAAEMAQWTPNSWRELTVGQSFEYPPTPAGKKGLPDVLAKLNDLPPLVSATEVCPPHSCSPRPSSQAPRSQIERLKRSLAGVANGDAFRA